MFEKEKERDVAPTRGQFPCPAFGPHGASLSAWVCLDFFLDLFSSFLFFLCPFSLGFSIQNALSLQHCQSGTPSHMRTDCHRSAGSKCQKSLGRFITLILTWSGQDVRDISSEFLTDQWARKQRAHCKKCPMMVKPLVSKSLCLSNTWGKFVIEMRPDAALTSGRISKEEPFFLKYGRKNCQIGQNSSKKSKPQLNAMQYKYVNPRKEEKFHKEL